MQKFVTKKLLFTLSGACLLAGGIIYAAGPQIIIDPTRFVSQERIQRINLNSTGTNTVKEALLNSGTKKPVLLIGSTPGNDNLGAVTRNNTITGDVSSVIGGKGNSNLGDETSLIAGSQDSIVKNNVKSTVILGGKNNTGSAANQVILSSEKTNVSKINGVAMGLSNSNIDSSYAIGLIGDKITISGASNSVALGSNINIQTGGMFIFNANGGTVNGNLKDTVFINAEHGLVIGGPKIIPSTVSNSKAVKLTVHGGVALGQGMCSKDTIGGIYYASGTTKTNGKISCICACVASGSTAKSIAVSNQPYCDVACKNTEGAGGNEKIDGSAVCGSRGYPGSGSKISQEHGKEMIYEAWETTWRPNSDFCKDGAIPNVGTLESNAPGVVGFPGTGMTVSWVCPGLTDKDPKVQCNAYKKVVPPKCGENAKKYYLNDDSYPVYSEGSFCEIGEFFGISNLSKTYSNYDFPVAGGTTTWGCKTNSGHVDAIENQSCKARRSDCNHCAKNGFPYCFDIDYTTVPGKPGCESNPDETAGDGKGGTEPVYNGTWKCVDDSVEDDLEINGSCTGTPTSSTSTVVFNAGNCGGIAGYDDRGRALYYECDGPSGTLVIDNLHVGCEALIDEQACNAVAGCSWLIGKSGISYKLKMQHPECRNGFTKLSDSECDPANKPSCDGFIDVVQPVDSTYLVKYDCNGGSNPPSNQSFKVGASQSLNPNTCTRTSYAFKGWSKTKGGSKDYDNQATVDLGGTANSVITLYAVWQRVLNPELLKCPSGCFYVAAVDQCYKNSCFIAGTKVIMADGSEKNIEDISKGDMVLGANGEYNTVQGLHMPKLGSKKLWSINGGKNFFTEEHPFMTTEGWKAINSELAMQEIDLEVGELQVGDVLVTNNGYVVIKSLEGVEGDKDTQLYNLMLDGDHTYYADDYLVHNKQRMLEYADGGSCPRGTELRGDGCCPSNMWGKNNECVPLCDENPDPDPNPTTTTYSWTCVSDESQAYCDNNSSYQYCSEVNCHGNTSSSCYNNYYLPKRGSSWGYLALWDGSKCPGYPSVCVDGDTTWYRCCDWITSVNKCKSSNGNIVLDSYCSGQTKKDCSKFKESSDSLLDPSI